MKDKQPQPVSDALLRQLVEGMLTEQEYQRVIQCLESTPDGWRRCSLAFLEEQALHNELERIDFDSIDFQADDFNLKEIDPNDENANAQAAEAMRQELAAMGDDSEMPVENALWKSLFDYEKQPVDDRFLTDDVIELKANTRLQGPSEKQSRSRLHFGRRFWTNLSIGSIVGVMCVSLSMHWLTSPAENLTDNSNPLKNQIRNVDNSRVLSVSNVPVSDKLHLDKADPVADSEFFDSMISPSEYVIDDVANEIQSHKEGTLRFDTQIRRYRLVPRENRRFQ